MNRKHLALMIGGVVLLVAATAGASAYITQKSMEPEAPAAHKVTVKKENIAWNEPRAAAPTQNTNCNDHNVVGKVGGGIAGGILGSQIGDGNGKTAGTIAGTLGGSYLGGKYLPTQNVTCK
jgi:uncharacterized protein YcfJ